MRNIYLLCFSLILYTSLFSQGQAFVKQWDKRFGGIWEDELYSFIRTSDGGYLLGGWSYNGISDDKTQPNKDTTNNTTDFWIVKTDSLGNKEWDKDFGSTTYDDFYAMDQSKDGGYLLGGRVYCDVSGDVSESTRDVGTPSGDFWVVKIDATGNKMWDRRFGGASTEFLRSIKATSDGGFILAGDSESGVSGDKTEPNRGSTTSDYWMVKIDSNGDKQWDKRFGGVDEDELFSIIQTTDKGYLLGGVSVSDTGGDKSQPTQGGGDYWIVKTDSNGGKQWDKRYGSYGVDVLYSVLQTHDGGYIIGGWSDGGISGDKTGRNKSTPVGSGVNDFWVVKTDSAGNKEWDADIGGSGDDILFNIIQGYDGGYILCGTSTSPVSGDKTEPNLGYYQPWVVKIDSLGTKQWDKTVLTASTSIALKAFAVQSGPGCFSVATFTAGGIAGDKTQPNWDTLNHIDDYWMVKYCMEDTTVSGNAVIATDNRLSIFPNPVQQQLTVTYTYNGGAAEIQIFNTQGALIKKYGITHVPPYTLNVSSLPPGMYFLAIQDEKDRVVKKFVKVNSE